MLEAVLLLVFVLLLSVAYLLFKIWSEFKAFINHCSAQSEWMRQAFNNKPVDRPPEKIPPANRKPRTQEQKVRASMQAKERWAQRKAQQAQLNNQAVASNSDSLNQDA